MQVEKKSVWEWLISLQCQITDLKEQLENLTLPPDPDPDPTSEFDCWRLFRLDSCDPKSNFEVGRKLYRRVLDNELVLLMHLEAFLEKKAAPHNPERMLVTKAKKIVEKSQKANQASLETLSRLLAEVGRR